MKRKHLSVFIFGLVLATASLFYGTQEFGQLTLAVQADKGSYLLGDLITLKFRLVNKSKEVVFLQAYPDVFHGELGVFIAYADKRFRGYLGPGWGLNGRTGKHRIPLGPGEIYETEATVLYNHRFETSHLNEDAARPIKEKLIGTEYALPKSGTYHIKAILSLGSKNEIESEPIEIRINEPQNIDDVEVWNVLKSDPEYAYFIQTGSTKTGPSKKHPGYAKSQRVVENLENIVNFYSASRYGEHIRSALAKHRASIKRLKKAGLIKPE